MPRVASPAWREAKTAWRSRGAVRFAEYSRVRCGIAAVSLLLLGRVEQLLQILLPEHAPGVGAVAVGRLGGRDQDELAALDPLDLALGDRELGRGDEVVGAVHEHD